MIAIKSANWKALLGWAVVIGILALPWFSLSGAMAIFLRLDNIQGSGSNPTHSIKDQIEVYAWSNGASNSSTFNQPGNTSLQDLSVTKPMDRSTPVLFLRLVTGTVIPTGDLSVYTTATAKDVSVNILKIGMENITVTSQSQGGSAGSDTLMENVSFNFSKFTITYTPILSDDTIGTAISYGWDIETLKAF